MWLLAREAIDAGAADVAVDRVRAFTRPVPHAQALLAAVEAAATGDENRWHDALNIAVDQGLRLIAVDALEGLAIAAATAKTGPSRLRLLASAQRLRNETGYQWRFAFEQRAVNAARNTAVEALGPNAEGADTKGRSLNWRAAAAHARRTRGARSRALQD